MRKSLTCPELPNSDDEKVYGRYRHDLRKILRATPMRGALKALADHLIENYLGMRAGLEMYRATRVPAAFVGRVRLAGELHRDPADIRDDLVELASIRMFERRSQGPGRGKAAEMLLLHSWFVEAAHLINTGQARATKRAKHPHFGIKKGGISAKKGGRFPSQKGGGVSPRIFKTESLTESSIESAPMSRQLQLELSGAGETFARQEVAAGRADLEAFVAWRKAKGLRDAEPEVVIAAYLRYFALRGNRLSSAKRVLNEIARHSELAEGVKVDVLDERIIDALVHFSDLSGAYLLRLARAGAERARAARTGHRGIVALRNHLLLLLRLFHHGIDTARLLALPRGAAISRADNIFLELGEPAPQSVSLWIAPAHLAEYCPTASMRRWLACLDTLSGNDFLFPGFRGGHLNIMSHRLALKPIITEALGTKCRITPDRLRGKRNIELFLAAAPAALPRADMATDQTEISSRAGRNP